MSGADHLLPIATKYRELASGATHWTLWRWVRIRGAGFPAAQVLDLAAEACEAAVDRVLRCDEVCEKARREAVDACRRQLAAVPPAGRAALRKILRRLRSATPQSQPSDLAPVNNGGELTSALAELARTADRAREARQEARASLAEEELRIARRLYDQAHEPRFREAVGWQNREAVHQALDRLLRETEEADNAHARRRLSNRRQLVAGYLQRYCVKNDTIGFFGPTGWGTFAADGPAIELRPGRSLLAEREVFFEYWAIDAVAAKLAQDPALKPWLAPRRSPAVRVEATTLHHPIDRSSRLPPAHAWLLARCDGERPARELAREMLAQPALGVASEDRVYALLAQLEKNRLISWILEIPTEPPYPEAALGRLLDRIGDPELRARVRAVLDELETRRAAVARAAGDAPALDRALGELEAWFRKATGEEPTRRPGQTYGGRTLVYEDCRRDVELVIGRQIRARFGPALALVLTSARWFTHAVAARYRTLLERCYASLRRETGQSAVDYLRFLAQIKPHFATDQYQAPPAVQETVQELQARWGRILAIAPQSREIVRDPEALAAEVEAAFSAPAPGWPLARYHSPDLLIASPHVDAIRRGEATFVLGELHAGCNMLLAPAALLRHPHREDLFRARAADLPGSSVAPVMPKQGANRAAHLSLFPDDFHIEVAATRSWRPRDQVLEAAQLVVGQIGGRLQVHTRDGKHRFDALAFFEHDLQVAAMGHFELVPGARHRPRILLGDLVIAREQWRFEPEEMPFVHSGDRVDRVLEACCWARRHGLPRFVFVKVPAEPKPFYVDFLSPILLEIFARRARRAAAVTVTEMLPAHGQHWLTDAEGRIYTCELRIAAVDPCAWRPPDHAPAADD